MKALGMVSAGQASATWLLPLGVLLAVGCSGRGSVEISAPQQLTAEVRAVLGSDWLSPEYHRSRSRLQQMGPEVDSVLVDLVEDARARPEARADALVLLADRSSPLALPTLDRALQYDNERLRSAAVQGLSRLMGTSNLALELIRRATGDRSRTVRMSALQSLGAGEVDVIRKTLERERDPEVRQVALQLVLLAESRGAALARDERGSLRSAAGEGEPQIVFRSVSHDEASSVASGDLRVELAEKPDIPIAASATVVADVVPAFFSPDRAAIVVEDDGEIRVFDVGTAQSRTVGRGIAPRLVPFAYQFVFLREKERSRPAGSIETTIVYEVYRSSFSTSDPELIGELTARTRGDVNAGESPVRWMVVDEVADGFQLRGDNVDTFKLPTPVWGAGRPNGAGN